MSPEGISRRIRDALAGLAFLAILGTAASAQSSYELEIRTGTLVLIQIHLEDFLRESTIPPVVFSTGESLEEVLVRDLVHSSFFEVSRGAVEPAGPGLDPPPIPPGTRAIAGGSVRRSWGRLVLDGNLRDATSGNRIFTKEYPLDDPPDRWAVHAFADDIAWYLTGIRGVAQTRIAFVRDLGGRRELFLIDSDGANEERLTDLSTILLSPSWAPTGDRIAMTRFGPDGAGVAGVALRDGKWWPISPAGVFAASPSWSPDGREIAYTQSVGGNIEIFLCTASGSNPVRLTHAPSIDTSPTFSPDGSRIAFTSDRSGRPQIYVMDRSGGSVQRLTFQGLQNDSPDWSPQGDRIAFVSMLDGVFDICTIRPDGSDLRRLTANEGMHENPRWAPDGRHLVYSKLQAGSRRIHIMASDASGKRVLTSGGAPQYNPAWSPALRSRVPRDGN